jgi:hypothetical protein
VHKAVSGPSRQYHTGHTRSKNGIASLAYARWSMLSCSEIIFAVKLNESQRSMDCRVKPGNDRID